MPIQPEPNTTPAPGNRSPSFVLDPRIGKTIGQCLIQQKLGQGGMGTVYLARHLTLNKPVAVKVLRTDLPTDLQGVERFLREARAAARLEHPRIVQVYDAGQFNGSYYIVMQYVPGESLATRLRREKKLPLREALRIFRSVAEAIQHAHAQGIVHRDIKPDNILLDTDGKAKIVDFGLAYMVEGDCSISRSGLVIGSPSYMSPEQASGRPVDQRTDIYSLGATLYLMLTGLPPFTAASAVAIVCKVVKDRLKLPREVNPDVPEPISNFVGMLMAKDRNQRVGTVQKVLDLLDEVEKTSFSPPAKPRPRPRRLALLAGIAVAAALLVTAGGIWLLEHSNAEANAEATSGKAGASGGLAAEGEGFSTEPGLAGRTVRDPTPWAPEDDKTLRARFEEFRSAVNVGSLAEVKELVDPVIREHSPRPPRVRTLSALNRILGDLGDLDMTRATIAEIGWYSSARGIAFIEVGIPGNRPPVRQMWVRRQNAWYIHPALPWTPNGEEKD
jgi:predicted Ser/Thr protein kinase